MCRATTVTAPESLSLGDRPRRAAVAVRAGPTTRLAPSSTDALAFTPELATPRRALAPCSFKGKCGAPFHTRDASPTTGSESRAGMEGMS